MKRENQVSSLLGSRKCPVCGKEYYIQCDSEDYAWRLNDKMYCSYGCMRVEELKSMAKIKRTRWNRIAR